MFQQYFHDYRKEFNRIINDLNFSTIEEIYQLIVEARENEKQIFIMGNGGSGASASHWTCDFAKGVNVPGMKRLRIFSLSDQLPLISALGNDLSYSDIFVEQLKNYLKPTDIVIGLSVSGQSENVVKAFSYAKEIGATVVSLVGQNEGEMKALSDVSLVIPSQDYGIVEDVHMFINHVISQYMRMENEKSSKFVTKD